MWRVPLSVFSSRPRLLRAAVACAVLLGLAGYVAAHVLTGGGGPPRCTVRAGGEEVLLDPEQAVNAATVEAVAAARGLPERAVTIALATAFQESGLRNLRHGDRDSLGLFQQRPSQGWGTAAQIQDPVYAAGKFYDRLVRVPGYSRLPLTVAAQRVQFSGYPQAYAKHETEAVVLTAALTGRAKAAISCPGPPDDGTAGDPERVRSALVREFGREARPRLDTAGQGGGKHAPTARAVLVPVRPATARGGTPERGWELAHWAVAHSDELRIERVSYGKHVWNAGNSGDGWHTSDENSGPDVTLVLER
ncbi:hypothetical protein HUT19_14000 [Streptomyces sp. NA02950]|uniref:hypothetical protein n=1 Tax=Streptomyces sp. NA02950 TaxID=2742137 RepID=UPI001590EC6F|nr:hypothetical protein [Streptomyces sp. NA02950]QKV92727.1 hypothetical protein HUT19_14000 [Streptomyces sp. NA02950]